MRIIKIILYSLLGIIAVLALLLAFILGTYTQQDYQRLLIRSVDRFFDYRLTISGSFDFTPSLDLSLLASGISLHSKMNDNRILVDHFETEIDLRPFFQGTLMIRDLIVENMEMHINSVGKMDRDRRLLQFLPFPVVEHAAFTNVRVFSNGKESQALSGFQIEAAGIDQPVNIRGVGQYRNKPFFITGRLGLLSQYFDQKQPFPVDLNVEWAQSKLSIQGTIKKVSRGEGMDMDVNFNSPVISAFLDDDIPLQGRISGQGRITGDYDELELSGFRAELSHDSSLNIEVSGSIENLLTFENTDLHISGNITDQKFLKWMLPKKSPPFNHLVIQTDLTEDKHTMRLENADVRLTAPEGLEVQLNGRTRVVFDRQPFRSMEIKAAFTSSQTEPVKYYLGNILPEMGKVKGTANITTQGREFVLANIDLKAGHGMETQLTATGFVGPLSIDPKKSNRKIILDLALKAEKSSGLAALLGIVYPEIGPVKINAHLSGSVEELSLKNIRLKAGYPERITIMAEGEMNWSGLDSGHPVQFTDIELYGSTPSFRNAFLLYGKNMPDLGPAKASMRVQGTGMVLTGSNLNIRVGDAVSMLISAKGKVEQIFLENFYNKGIEVSAAIEGTSTKDLSRFFEQSKFPDIGPFNGLFTILGDSDTLNVPKVTLSAGRKNGLMLNASGRVDQIPLKEAPLPNGVRIQFNASAPSTDDLSAIAGEKIPDMGPLKITGRLLDQRGVFAVQDLSVLAGKPKQPTLSAQGNIEDLFSQNGIKINILFDEQTLIKLFDLSTVPELGRLKGRLLLSDASGSLGIEEIQIETDHSKLIDLKIKGGVNDLLKSNKINLNMEFSIPDLTLFGKLFDIDFPDLGPVKGAGRWHGKEKNGIFNGRFMVGKTALDSDISISFTGRVPSVKGKISSPNIYLKDFGVRPEGSTSKGAKRKSGPLFSREPLTLSMLQKINLDLNASAREVTGARYHLDKMNVNLSLQNGRLKIKPAKFVFSEGSIVLNGEVDASTKPEFTLSVKGQSIQLGDLISELRHPPAIEGSLDLIVDLNSRGSTPHEVVSNLSGDFDLMLEGGRIRKRELELLFLNPLGWLFSHGITGNELKISCGLARYKIHQGIANSEVLYINGPKLTARGRSKIDLKKETIDALANLEKKKLLFNTRVSLQIKGSLADPEVNEAPIDSPILKADRYLLSPAAAVPQELFGTLWGFVDKKEGGQGSCQGVTAQ